MEEQGPPRVTALIVSRNVKEQLSRCLASLERSTNRDLLQILVVDDGSTDGTARVPEEFEQVISLKLPKRMGWTRAANIGLRTAKGNLILFMPAWFEVEPDTIERLADRLESSSGAGAVIPHVDAAWAFPKPSELSEAWRTGKLPNALAMTGGEQAVDYAGDAPVLMRRDLVRAMNWLDERFGDRWADLEMYSRIRSGGKSVLVLHDIPVKKNEAPLRDTTQNEWADSANGVATWIGLHQGWWAGFQSRLGMAFHALGRGRAGAFTSILSFSKIDGHQE